MSDEPVETAAQRAEGHTQPPDEIMFPAPTGSVLYAPVADDDGLAAYVWVASPGVLPRAGLVLVSGRDPSERVQDDLGPITLNIDPDRDGAEFLDRLNESFDGFYGRPVVGGASSAPNLDAVRALARQP